MNFKDVPLSWLAIKVYGRRAQVPMSVVWIMNHESARARRQRVYQDEERVGGRWRTRGGQMGTDGGAGANG